jgi:HK97 family phage portal protein
VILATARGGNREYRTPEFGSSALPTYTQFLGHLSSSGQNVSLDKAAGLAGCGAAIRLLAETVAGLPLQVFTGQQADKRPARESWQHLLMEAPNPDQSPFDFLSDVAVCVETHGNAFIRKLKIRGKVVALAVLDPFLVQVKRDEGNQKTYVLSYGGARETLGAGSVLHVRGFTLKGGDVGLSPIALHRETLGSGLALEKFQGSYFANDTTPGTYMQVPGPLNRTQAKEMSDLWASTHGGPGNAGKFGILYNGAELKNPGIPLRDAQFVEAQQFSMEQQARIYLGPSASLLFGPADKKPNEQDSLRFFNFALLPRLRRLEWAFRADMDLFAGTDLYPQFQLDEFLRADAATQAQVRHNDIQSGVLLVDEARAEMGRPPLPDGMGQIPQITPVGGSPNPVLNPSPNGSQQQE